MSTCSYCWGYGHNKRGCPKMKKDAADDVAAGRESYRTRYVEKQAHASKNRRCSYCKEVGHTRRTCGTLEEQMVHFIGQTKKLHRAYAAALRRHGIGPGTLIRSGRDVYDYGLDESIEKPLAMVKLLDWHKITTVNFRNNFIMSETAREYQRSSYNESRNPVVSYHSFPEIAELFGAAFEELQGLGAGYQYPKNENELFELVSTMPITDADADWPLDEGKINYKAMAKEYFEDRTRHCGNVDHREPIIDKWCELLEKV
jgi:hypothetical protein